LTGYIQMVYRNGSRIREATAVVAVIAAVLIVGGCSPAHYRSDADRETYAILKQKSPAVRGTPEEFSIEPHAGDPLEGAQAAPEASILPEEVESPEEGEKMPPLQISLAKALEIAAAGSRDYQSRKEALFLSALDLSLERDRFEPQFFGDVTGTFRRDSTGEESVEAGASVLASWLLATGGTITANLNTALQEFLRSGPSRAAESFISLTFVQPLLRGRTIAVTENLTQAERDVIYELRRFVRFQRTFFVSVLSEYYRVLEARQILRNQKMNYDNLVKQRERAEWLSKAGELPEFQVDQTRQDELEAKDRLERAQQTYHQALDSFKLTLAIPTETDLVLDMKDLETLGEKELGEIPFSRERAIEISLVERLDFQTAVDGVYDADRKVKVAINELKPGLDLVLSSSAETEGDTKPLKFEFNKADSFVELDLELPLERTAERNAYRKRLIQLEAAKREADEFRDRVVLDVRDRWRAYHRARRSYEIQKDSVKLAEGRVESTTLLLEAGLAIPRDMLEAQEALLRAQNSLTQALVDYIVARLQLARDMGILQVGLDGELEESFDEYAEPEPKTAGQ